MATKIKNVTPKKAPTPVAEQEPMAQAKSPEQQEQEDLQLLQKIVSGQIKPANDFVEYKIDQFKQVSGTLQQLLNSLEQLKATVQNTQDNIISHRGMLDLLKRDIIFWQNKQESDNGSRHPQDSASDTPGRTEEQRAQ
jgi:hypothetical protein